MVVPVAARRASWKSALFNSLQLLFYFDKPVRLEHTGPYSLTLFWGAPFALRLADCAVFVVRPVASHSPAPSAFGHSSGAGKSRRTAAGRPFDRGGVTRIFRVEGDQVSSRHFFELGRVR
jgi:hypothetical protein